ncbi:MAG: MerR family transcriptional regulator [Pseudohongiella sp.]|nr:MerR family transcriptional regulator [Pseudohongiella sp.]
MLNSKQLIEMTGISRATLNNYVALGILPSPIVKTSDNEGRATRLGYFEDEAIDRINRVKQMKKQGLTMAQIAKEIGDKRVTAKSKTSTPTPVSGEELQKDVPSAGRHRSPTRSLQPDMATSKFTLDSSIDELPGPTYLVNNNLELIWWNKKAEDSFFDIGSDLPNDLGSRNLIKLLFGTAAGKNPEQLMELLKPHLAAAKKRLSQQALIKIYSDLNADELSVLELLYALVEPLGKEPMVHFPTMLVGDDGVLAPHDLYVSFYREGIFFTYSPVVLHNDFLLEFLSKRNRVIHELLNKRKPYLTDVTVMVADVQNSIKICSELPAEEYFDLINDIWQASAPIFRKYYGTYGKHAGDGMVYYFFPQPDCDYKQNAIECALELKQMMKDITRQWQSRKGWFSDIFLNIGLNEGQEWFGSYHAGDHVEFTLLGDTINYASRISDFARNGSIWATKNMLNQIPQPIRGKISFGITRKTRDEETVFVTDTYASIGSIMEDYHQNTEKFKNIQTIPITEIRAIELKDKD